MKAQALTRLASAGLRTVETRLVRSSELRLVPFEGRDLLYARGVQTSGTKVSVTGSGETLADQLSSHEDVEEWLVQPMIDFDWGGAAFSEGGLIHVEGVAGSPMSLLRLGELALALTDAAGRHGYHAGSQRAIWDPVSEERRGLTMGVDTASVVVNEVRELLARSRITGLVEWGSGFDGLYFLDHKSSHATGALRAFLEEGPAPVEPTGRPCVRLETPDLIAMGDVDDRFDLLLQRGARLSHLVTYRCARANRNIYFESW